MGRIDIENPVVKHYESLTEDVDTLEGQKGFYKDRIEEYEIEIRSIDRRIEEAIETQQQLQKHYYSILREHYNNPKLVSELMSYGNTRGDKNCHIFASLIENRLQGNITPPISDIFVLWYLRQIEKSKEEKRIPNRIRIEYILERISQIVPYQEKQDENLIKWEDRALIYNNLDNENGGFIAEDVMAESKVVFTKSKESKGDDTST